MGAEEESVTVKVLLTGSMGDIGRDVLPSLRLRHGAADSATAEYEVFWRMFEKNTSGGVEVPTLVDWPS